MSEEFKDEMGPQGLIISEPDHPGDNLSVEINESIDGDQDENMKAVLTAIMNAQFQNS